MPTHPATPLEAPSEPTPPTHLQWVQVVPVVGLRQLWRNPLVAGPLGTVSEIDARVAQHQAADIVPAADAGEVHAGVISKWVLRKPQSRDEYLTRTDDQVYPRCQVFRQQVGRAAKIAGKAADMPMYLPEYYPPPPKQRFSSPSFPLQNDPASTYPLCT